MVALTARFIEMNNYSSKIVIGTAQWGMNYGISNDHGQTSIIEAQNILAVAQQAGITLIDTASLYGNAEAVIGTINSSKFLVSSKTPHLHSEYTAKTKVNLLIDSLENTLKRLNSRLCIVYSCIMLKIFSAGGALIDSLEILKRNKFLKIGLSIYEASQMNVLEFFTPDVIQLPLSIIDQRLLKDGTIKRLSQLGVEIHARSIFLQGLMLMDVAKIPSYFNPWLDHMKLWHNLCSDNKILPQVAALRWACSIEEISYVVVGIQSSAIRRIDIFSLRASTPKF